VGIIVLPVSGGRIYGLTAKARSLLGLRVARTEIVLREGADGRQERLAREVLATELESALTAVEQKASWVRSFRLSQVSGAATLYLDVSLLDVQRR